MSYVNKLECSKATGLDGIGPRTLKIAAHDIYRSIAMLINKSMATGIFPTHLRQGKVLPIFEGGTNQTRYPSCQQYQRFSKNILTNTLWAFLTNTNFCTQVSLVSVINIAVKLR